MVDVSRLKAELCYNNISQKEMAEKLGMAPKTFYIRMKKGVFTTIEIEKMVNELHLEYSDAINIFFASKVE